MKGQERIIGEILIFAIGLAITSFVVVNFDSVEQSIDAISSTDQLDRIADVVQAAVVKVSLAGDATVRLHVPAQISANDYRIQLVDDHVLVSLLDNETQVTRKIFNINKKYVISGNVVGSAEYVEVTATGNQLMLARRDI